MSLRRTVGVAAATLAIVTLAGCASSGSASPGGSPSAAPSATAAPSSAGSASAGATSSVTSIFFANPLPSYPDFATADKCFLAETQKLGIKGVTQGPTGTQINDQFVLDRISQAIAQDYNGLIAVPITPAAYEPLFKRAKDKGMFVATVNTGTSTSTQDFTIGTDYTAQGTKVAGEIGKRGGQQNIGVVTSSPGGVGDTIVKAFTTALPANAKVAATVYVDDPATAADKVGQMLRAHPEINIIWSWQGTSVAGMVTAINEQKKVGQVLAVVNDLNQPVIDGIRAGTIYGTSVQNFCGMLTGAVDGLVGLGAGKPVSKSIDTGTTFVTKDNLDQVLAQPGS